MTQQIELIAEEYYKFSIKKTIAK